MDMEKFDFSHHEEPQQTWWQEWRGAILFFLALIGASYGAGVLFTGSWGANAVACAFIVFLTIVGLFTLAGAMH